MVTLPRPLIAARSALLKSCGGAIIVGAALGSAAPAFAASPPRTAFAQTALVSSQARAGVHQDTDLVNPWGVAVGNDGFFWVSDNGTGKSTLYDGSGVKSSLVVTLPNPAGAAPSAPTGQVLNTKPSSFLGDSFIFDTEGGTVLGWQGGFAAVVRADQSANGAVYKGLALASTAAGDFLFAADFHNAKIDVFDASYNLVPAPTPGRFVDPAAPQGFAPFNIHLVGSQLYVTYAKQDSELRDDVAGAGNGFISVFGTDGTFVKRFATGSNAGGKLKQLNSPWGIAVAPKAFGSFSGHILVGNFGSGQITAFDRKGKFVAALTTKAKRAIKIDGLWEIFFGRNGTGDPKKLYFTAGPNEESGGLLGYLAPVTAKATSTPKPRPTIPGY